MTGRVHHPFPPSRVAKVVCRHPETGDGCFINNKLKNMKKILYIAAFVAAAIASISVSAKEDRIPFHSNKVTDNVFVTVKGGVNSVLDNGTFTIGGPAVAVEAGKWLTPYTAVRFGWQGLTNRTADSANGWFSGDDAFSFNFVHADWMLDLTAAVFGYKAERIVNARPYIKAGAIFTGYGQRHDTELGAGAGLDLAFRIVKRVYLTADISNVWAREEAWRTAGKVVSFPSATAGVSVALGRDGFERHTDTERIVTVPADCDHEATINALKDEIARLKALKAKSDTVLVERVLDNEMAVYFTIDKWDISVREAWHLKDLVDAVPADATLTLTGHADKNTGSAKRNAFLAEKRVQAVEKAIRDLGFKGTVKSAHKGDRENPFKEPYQKNRTVTIKVTL